MSELPQPPPAESTGITGTRPAMSSDRPPREVLPPGAHAGRYEIVGQLGAGGMGVVYAAYDPKLDRRVALKALHRERGEFQDPTQPSRLVEEAQSMARLAHPNVVTVHDVFIEDGQAFVAMELVDGESLRHWMNAAARRWREVVKAFIQAGRGLAAAHAAGIVHADFKPENVLVGKDGRVRVGDFGLAHAAPNVLAPPSVPLDEAPVARIVSRVASASTVSADISGTPGYMAPEQFRGMTADARSDQFSFCVALYEALYGRLPDESGVVREESPELPTPAKKADVPSWIRRAVLRGLRFQPQERFASMNELLAELEADPNRGRLRLAAVVAGALIVAGLASLRTHRPTLCPSAQPQVERVWGESQKRAIESAFRATKLPYAEDAIRGAEGAIDAYARSWLAMHQDACEATHVRGEQSAELLDLRMECLNGRLSAVGSLGSELAAANAGTVQRAVTAANALPSLDVCADSEALRAPGLPTDPNARKQIETVRKTINEALAKGTASTPADAVPIGKAAVDAALATGFRPLEAEARLAYGSILHMAGDEKAAGPMLDEAVLAAEAARDDYVEARAWIRLVQVANEGRHEAEGRAAAKHASALLERAGPQQDAERAQLHGAISFLAYRAGHLAEARDHANQALAIQERRLPPDHFDIAACLVELANVAYDEGNFALTVQYERRALAIVEKAMGPMHPSVAVALLNLGNALGQLGQTKEAIEALSRSLEIRVAVFGAESLSVANLLYNRGIAFGEAGDAAHSHEDLERSLSIRTKLLGPDDLFLAATHLAIADLELDLGDWDEAIANASKDFAVEERVLGPNEPRLFLPLGDVGKGLLGKGDAVHALPVLERAVRLAEKAEGTDREFAATKVALATALLATHPSAADTARAKRLVSEARETFTKVGAAAAKPLAKLNAQFPPP